MSGAERQSQAASVFTLGSSEPKSVSCDSDSSKHNSSKDHILTHQSNYLDLNSEVEQLFCNARDDVVNNLVGAIKDLTHKQRMDLVEVCAPWDSPLADAVDLEGGFSFRMGLHNGFDLTSEKGFRKAAQFLRKHKPRYVHASPTCFPWSPMQNCNQKNPQQIAELKEKRRVGRIMLQNVNKLIKI